MAKKRGTSLMDVPLVAMKLFTIFKSFIHFTFVCQIMGLEGTCVQAHVRYAVPHVRVLAKWPLKHECGEQAIFSLVTLTHIRSHILLTFQRKLMDIPDFDKNIYIVFIYFFAYIHSVLKTFFLGSSQDKKIIFHKWATLQGNVVNTF